MDHSRSTFLHPVLIPPRLRKKQRLSQNDEIRMGKFLTKSFRFRETGEYRSSHCSKREIRTVFLCIILL